VGSSVETPRVFDRRVAGADPSKTEKTSSLHHDEERAKINHKYYTASETWSSPAIGHGDP